MIVRRQHIIGFICISLLAASLWFFYYVYVLRPQAVLEKIVSVLHDPRLLKSYRTRSLSESRTNTHLVREGQREPISYESGITNEGNVLVWDSDNESFSITDTSGLNFSTKLTLNQWQRTNIFANIDLWHDIINKKHFHFRKLNDNNESMWEFTIPLRFIAKVEEESMRQSILLAQEIADLNRDEKGCVGPMFRNLKITDVKIGPLKKDLIILIDASTKKVKKIQEPVPDAYETYFNWQLCNKQNITGTGYYKTDYMNASGSIVESFEAME